MKTDSTTIRKRYDRLAPYFDGLEAVMEGLLFRSWRKQCWAKAKGGHILEVGVGTGKNFPYYPADARVTAIDFSPGMLKQAERNQQRKNISVALEQMDVQGLYYADNSFDTVIATFVFCSVPQPLKGLQELYRVCKPGGQVILLEHVLSANPLLAWLMERLNPLVVWLVGANINRTTVKHVQSCPFQWVRVDPASNDIIKLIVAKK